MTIWNFILVLLIVWLVNTIIIIVAENASDDVETIAVYCACGIWVAIINGVIKLCRIIHRNYKRKHYKAILLDNEGRVCYIDSYNADFAINELGYKWADYIRNKYTIDDGFKSKDSNGYLIPNLRYTPMKIIKAEHAYEIKIDYKKVEE